VITDKQNNNNCNLGEWSVNNYGFQEESGAVYHLMIYSSTFIPTYQPTNIKNLEEMAQKLGDYLN